jgi:hypothetical protein
LFESTTHNGTHPRKTDLFARHTPVAFRRIFRSQEALRDLP